MKKEIEREEWDRVAEEEAKLLAEMVSEAIKKAPLNKDYGLCDRIWKSYLYTLHNLTKGSESSSKAEFKSLFSEARRSIADLKVHLQTAFEQSYIDRSKFRKLYDQTSKVSRGIVSSIQKLKKGKETDQVSGGES